MAMTVREIREWLDALPPDDLVAVDEGGLILQTLNARAYCEVGGLPEEYIRYSIS